MKDIVIFDIETKKSFDEVGGRDNLDRLGISVLGAYSYKQNKYFAYEENELDRFGELLRNTGVLVGFNSKGFDAPVLEPYLALTDYELAHLDLMDDVVSATGFRVALDNLASATIGAQKSADGLQAIRWYKEGKIEEIKKYCLQDVKVTKELYDYGKKYGQVIFYARERMKNIAVPVSWGKPVKKDIPQLIREALNKRKSLRIEYEDAPDGGVRARTVDAHSLQSDSFAGYCHLTDKNKIFRLEKVISAEITDRSYKMSEDVQEALF